MRCICFLLAWVALLTPRLFGQGVAPFRNGDVFEMRISGMPMEDAQQFAQQYTVGPDGMVNVPLIGEIKALGLTTPELERTLQKRFVAGKIFTQPTVIISLVQGVRMVTVIGGVRNPGPVAMERRSDADHRDRPMREALGDFPDLVKKSASSVMDSKIIGTFSVRDDQEGPSAQGPEAPAWRPGGRAGVISPNLLPGDQVVVEGIAVDHSPWRRGDGYFLRSSFLDPKSAS